MAKEEALQEIEQQLLLPRRESLLLRLLFRDAEASEEAALYEDLVFDESRQSFLLLLARLAKRSDFAYAPAQLKPRLQGLLRYHGVNNKLTIQPALSLLECLEAEKAALYGNSAMYAVYDGEGPRMMGVSDVWAAPGSAEEALAKAEQAGFACKNSSSLAALLQNSQGNVNLHKLLHMDADPDIWRRCGKQSFQNRSILVTDCADTLVLLLRSEFRRWCILPKREPNIKWYYDCACLLRHPSFPGWETVVERARELNSVQTVGFMLGLFHRAIPGWIPAWVRDALRLTPDKTRLLAEALQYGPAEKAYTDAISGNPAVRAARWIPRMRAKYYYSNTEVAYFQGSVTLGQLLRQHWGVERLSQVPGRLLRNKKKNTDEREE